MPGSGQKIRTDLKEAIAGLDFSANREELVKQTRGHLIHDQIFETHATHGERTYLSRQNVMKTIGDTE